MLAALLLLALQDVPAPTPCPFDRVVPLKLGATDPLLGGHGHSMRVEYTSEFSGTLHVWTKVDGDLDSFLRLEDLEGKLIAEDDNSGGGRTPYVKLNVEQGRKLSVLAATADARNLGDLELHLVAAPETEATRAASEASNAALAECKRLHAAGDVKAACIRVTRQIGELGGADGDDRSDAVCDSLWQLGVEGYSVGAFEPAKRAFGRVIARRQRTLPADHPDLQVARQALGATLYALGQFRGARVMFEQVLEARARTLPHEHPDLQKVRYKLAGTLYALGELSRAKTLIGTVLEIDSRTLPEDDPGLQQTRNLFAVTILQMGDLAGARSLFERVLEVESRTLPDDHPDLQMARNNLAATLKELKEPARAKVLFDKVLEVDSRTLPDDHPDLQKARLNVAIVNKMLGDIASARALLDKVIEVDSRTLPDDHPDLQLTRAALATAMTFVGDHTGARALEEKVLAVYAACLPEGHPDLQLARANLAGTLFSLGEFEDARALQQKVLEVDARTLPDDHPTLQRARMRLAPTLAKLGDLAAAKTLQEKVLEIDLRTLPAEHRDLQVARGNLAATMHSLGDLAGARLLEEQVLEVLSRTVPDVDFDLQWAQETFASTLYKLGELSRARDLQEKVLEIRSRTLAEGHPDRQRAREQLADTLFSLGDLGAARVLQEAVLEVRARTLPDDDPDLQKAREALAVTLYRLGNLEDARLLFEKVLEVRSRTLPDDQPGLQAVRMNLGATIDELGDHEGARSLGEKVLEVYLRTLPDAHPDVQMARNNLATTIRAVGDLAGARALQEKVFEIDSLTLPEDALDLQRARANLVETIASQVARASCDPAAAGETKIDANAECARCTAIISEICQSQLRTAREAMLSSSGREAEERCLVLAAWLSRCLSFACGFGVCEPLPKLEEDAFVLTETTRGAAIVSAEFARRASSAPKYDDLRKALRAASGELAALAQTGTTIAEFDRARRKRDSAERDLVSMAKEISAGGQDGIGVSPEAIAEALGPEGAAVGFRRFARERVDVLDGPDSTGQRQVRLTVVNSLCAFVLRYPAASKQNGPAPRPMLTLVDLGPIAPIEDAVREWRQGLGVGARTRGVSVAMDSTGNVHVRGIALRQRIFDPLLTALSGARRVVVALDDVLHLVPLEALPCDDSSLVGDHWELHTRTTLGEIARPALSMKPAGELVAFGNVDYGGGADSQSAGAATTPAAGGLLQPRAATAAGVLRGSAWSDGFAALPGTGLEVQGLARLFVDRPGPGPVPVLCERLDATRERLLALAPRARWLHIATHGWFGPESIKSWSDPEPLDSRSGLDARLTSEEEVRGMSPMLLCGLALAGANVPTNGVCSIPGLVTAEEIATLDLTNCELVVLSACDTNVGERRAGQGVHSLQMALQMAGARSVITSLWKVPDEATKDLMLDFYRRLWVEEKPKWKALWEAKKKLSDARDETGKPKYSTRDWAAWVLTGDPN